MRFSLIELPAMQANAELSLVPYHQETSYQIVLTVFFTGLGTDTTAPAENPDALGL